MGTVYPAAHRCRADAMSEPEPRQGGRAEKRLAGLNARAQRRENQRAILQELLVGGRTSRQRLAQATGLAQASISRISDELLGSGLLVELDGDIATERSGLRGPKSSLLDLNDASARVVSIYLESGLAEIGLHDLRARVLRRKKVHVDRGDPERALLDLRERALELARSEGGTDTELVGLGMGIPAGVDDRGRIILSQPWRDVPAAEIMAAGLDLPVVVDRIQRALATAEAWFGAGVGAHILVACYVSEAIGCGIAIDGQVIDGHNYLEGHIGHYRVPGGKRWCPSCGRRGCLGAETKDSVLVDSAIQTLGLDHDLGPDRVLEILYDQARQGDRRAISVLEIRSRYIGQALAHISTLLDPAVITLAGPKMVAGWDVLYPLLLSAWKEQLPLPSVERRTKLTLSPFGTDAALVASAGLALQRFYGNPQAYWKPLARSGGDL